ncbi:hypothetical protein [Brucella intermedia]|uniref:hypothetical protein n=1 Tax=Brucella intermedia TaxID=94625 RepID=UPI00235F5EF5|nr:hypothetical protein [Brucella intermedia]
MKNPEPAHLYVLSVLDVNTEIRFGATRKENGFLLDRAAGAAAPARRPVVEHAMDNDKNGIYK